MLPGGAAGIAAKLAAYDQCLRANQLFFDRVLLHMGQAPSALTTEFDPEAVAAPPFALGSWRVPSHHADKLAGTLHALSRDWSAEGAGERAESYAPLVRAVQASLPIGAKVLVPGSGLARLTCEISGAGYKSQGNDFDLFMLFTADFMLNGLQHYKAQAPQSPPGPEGDNLSHEQVTLHPWVHAACNNLSHADACRPILLPDTSAATILFAASDKARADEASGDGAGSYEAAASGSAAEVARARDLSMCAGEFLQAYDDTFGQVAVGVCFMGRHCVLRVARGQSYTPLLDFTRTHAVGRVRVVLFRGHGAERPGVRPVDREAPQAGWRVAEPRPAHVPLCRPVLGALGSRLARRPVPRERGAELGGGAARLGRGRLSHRRRSHGPARALHSKRPVIHPKLRRIFCTLGCARPQPCRCRCARPPQVVHSNAVSVHLLQGHSPLRRDSRATKRP